MGRPSLSFLFPRDDGVPDAELLRRFAEHRDEAAFELLVRRHADMVWTVCRGVAGSHHAAEDAFQASFLALATKADAVRDHLAGWLHRVAYRAALKARPNGRSELLQLEPTARDSIPIRSEGTERIHAELAALPDRYRLPIVLCDLEGLTHTEAATRLGWPVGSVSGRLVRAREALKSKLIRLGLAPAAIALTVAPLPAAHQLIRCTTTAATGGAIPPAVAALSHGVLSTMRIAKLKIAAAVVCGMMGVAGLATLGGIAISAPQDDPPGKAAGKKVEKPAEKPLVADAKQRARSVNQLKQILLAFHNYHSTVGQLPTDVVDQDGKPLLSWRVLILPYIGQQELYKKFKLDEAWDSPANREASQTVVKLYANGQEPKNSKYPMTFYQLPTGTGTIHEPGKKIQMEHVSDGLSNTIFVIEADKAVDWAKPDDLTYDLKKPVGVRGLFANVIHCGFGDGSVRTFAGGLSADAAKFMFGREDGENFDTHKYGGTGWLNAEGKQEMAEILKELDERTAELKSILDGNQKLLLELTKKQGERVRKAGNVGLASQLFELERLVEQEKERKQRLEELLKAEKE